MSRSFFCLFIGYPLLKQGGIAPAPTTILFQKALLQPLLSIKAADFKCIPNRLHIQAEESDSLQAPCRRTDSK